MDVPEPPLPSCVTVSQRAERDVLRPLALEPRGRRGTRMGVELIDGESLCLGIELSAAGDWVERLQLLPSSASPPLRAQLSRMPDGTSMLGLQNGTEQELQVEYVAPVDAANPYLNESGYVYVPPGERVYETLRYAPARLLIRSVRLLPLRREATERGLPRSGRLRVERDGVLVGIGLVGGYGVRQTKSSSLNRELAQNGYSLLGATQPVGTGTLWLEVARLRLDLYFFYGAQAVRHHETGDAASFSFSGGGLDVGWELLRLKSFTLYPFLGIGGGNRAVERKYEDQPPPIASISPAAPASRSIASTGWLLASGVAFDQALWTLWEDSTGFLGLSLGGKLGYQAQLSRSDWGTDSEKDAITFRGGPRAELAGFYGHFTLGIAARGAGF